MSDVVKIQAPVHYDKDEKYLLHRASFVRAAAIGILSADPWYIGYAPPPNLEKVLSAVAKQVEEDCPGEEVCSEIIKISHNELLDWFRKKLWAIPEFLAWNEWEGPSVHFISRDTPTPTKRTFIDLEAVLQQVMVYFRDDRRLNDDFDRRFKEEHDD